MFIAHLILSNQIQCNLVKEYTPGSLTNWISLRRGLVDSLFSLISCQSIRFPPTLIG
jgi:hypothetical protein